MSNPPWTVKLLSILRPVFWLTLVLTSFQANEIRALAQATDLAIGTTVKQAGAKRLGIDLAGQDYYDSGQMLRDLTFRNPGFEAETYQTVLDCVAVTATTCVDGNPWNVWPTNFLAGATFQVVNGAAAGETGTISATTESDYEQNANNNPQYGLTATYGALSTPLAAGDYLIVNMQVPGNPAAGWWSNVSGGATLVADTTDLAPDTPGKQALELKATNSGQSASVNEGFDTSAGRSFVQLNGSYTVVFKAKSLGGNSQINLQVFRIGGANYLNQNVTLTSSWQDYSYTFSASENGSAIGNVQMTFSVGGADVLLDDASLTEAAAADNPTAYRNAVVDRLRTLHPGVIRYMDGTDFGTSAANAVAPAFARQRAGFNSQSTEMDDVPMGVNEFMQLCQAVGAEPWYTMSGTESPQDMQNLIEFLGGSTSTTYGALRASEGQSAPWTSVFPVIHLELGNEMWNSGMTGEAIPDPVVYGQRAQQIFAAAKASPSYSAGSFDLIMGSFAQNPWYTQQEIANSSNYDSVDAAPYLFYTLSDFSSNEAIFGPMFAQPEQLDSNSNGTMYQQAQAAAAANPPAKLEVYETNLSTVSGTAPQTVVNQAVAGVGAGITVADHMLLMMRDLGITTQNMFALTEYENGFNNTATGASETTPIWGATIDMGGETNLNRPQFLAEQLANTAILPSMLAVTVTGANPTWNQALSANDTVQPIQLANAHYLQSFAFTDGTHYSVIVFNLSRSGALPVTFSGTNAPTGNVLVSQLTSGQITDNNEAGTAVVNTTQTNVANFQAATPYSLPPFSMTVFSWPGTTLPTSTTTLTATPTQGDTGANITFTANVTSQSGTTTPTGTVTFLDGQVTLGTATLDATGSATFATTSLPAGADSITASYGGDSSDSSSTSSPVVVNLTSNAVATTTALTASAAQVNTGQSVTFTATVSPASGTAIPNGTVTFLSGSTTLGSATLNSSGVATFATTALPAGTDSITASYGGSPTGNSSVSTPVSITVTQTVGSTTTALVASASQITPNQNVTFTATVTGASSTDLPTGTITFMDGATTLGTGTLNARGVASFQTSALTTGTHSITASYGGDSGDKASVSAAVTVTVAQGSVATTTALTASPTQINTGQSVTFTATVAATSGTNDPTGKVSFLNGTTIVGTAQLNASGVASFSTSTLPAGTDAITASYGGNNNFNSSVSAAVPVTVTQTVVATATALSASATQINSGQSVTLTAAVTPQAGNGRPTGTITFLDGTTPIGTATLQGRGRASISTTTLSTGMQSITASYSGDSADAASVSQAVTIVVNAAAVKTTTALTATPTQVNTGQNVTFTVAVTPQSGSTTPTGTISLLRGASIVATGTLNSSGVAVFNTTYLPAGSDTITASYGGDTGDLSSVSTPVVITVTQSVIATTTTLTSSSTQLQKGDNVVLTAVAAPQTGSTTPTGTVTFLDGASAIGTATLNGSGVAFFRASNLAVGNHSITAVYGGSSSNSTSTSSPVLIAVAQGVSATTTALWTPSYQITLGQGTSFTATVAAQTGSTPTGTVAFLDGGNIIKTAAVSNSGTAYLSTNSLSLGTHLISASYSGSAGDSSSSSITLTITVVASQAGSKVATQALLTASPTATTAGQPVALTATIVSQSSNDNPTGSVEFFTGSTAIGEGALAGGVATLSTSTLPVGSDVISARYSGDTENVGSASSPVTVVVSAAQTTPPTPPTPPAAPSATATTLVEASSQVNSGQSAGFTATVVRQTGSGVPTGTVTFRDGQTVLGTDAVDGTGTATYSTSALSVGAHTITASYGGDSADAASTSTAVTETVVTTASPNYTMAVSSSDVTVTRGQVANLTVTLTPLNGFNSEVTLACSGLPAGTSCSFNPPTVTPDGKPVSSTLSILASDPSSSTSENRQPAGPSKGRLALGLVMPWGLLSLLGLRKRSNRSQLVAWSARVAVTVALIAGSLWMSGCGYAVNGSVFTMVVTSSGKNVATKTSQITVNISQ